MMGTELGRLRYRTAEEARGAARDLGLTGIHSHQVDGERIWMPGRNHQMLNDALTRRGKEETMVPGGEGNRTGIGMAGGMEDIRSTVLPDGGSEFEISLIKMAGDTVEENTSLFRGNAVELDDDVDLSVSESSDMMDDLGGELVGDKDGDGDMEIY